MSFREVRKDPKPTPPEKLLNATITSDLLPTLDETPDIERKLVVKHASLNGGVIFYFQRPASEQERRKGSRSEIAGDLFAELDTARAFARAILELVGD